mmetsp:Transcript_117069/g.342916  ORF Transcript_117069/g.342916 Transcript_117069/m.342916 type:complete len:696 (+) Transcript_117069:62-2149(+)
MVVGGELAIGLILAVLSAFFNGTFSIFGKLCKTTPDPIVFNTAMTFGVLLSSLVSVALQPAVEAGGIVIGWSWFGALAGTLLVFATLFSFSAIPLAGLAVASATWCCSGMVVSFLWGAVGPWPLQKPMKSTALSMAAIVLLVLGVLIINQASQLAAALCRQRGLNDTAAHDVSSEEGTELSSSASDSSSGGSTRLDSEESEAAGAAGTARYRSVMAPELERCNEDGNEGEGAKKGEGSNAAGRAVGLAFAVLTGFFGGSVLAPAAYIGKNLQGLRLLPSFGVAAAAVGVLVSLAYWVALRRKPLLGLIRQFRPEVLGYGILSGIFWNLGNICQVVAQSSFGLSYGIAYPILQCALLFSGIWGIYFFKEQPDRRAIVVFWIGALVLMCGVVLLGIYGPGAGDRVIVQTPQDFLAALQLVAGSAKCNGTRYEVTSDLFGTLTYYDSSRATGIASIGAGKPNTWLSENRMLSMLLNNDTAGCCGVGTMAVCLCKIAQSVGIIDDRQHLSYLKSVPPYHYVYVGLRAQVTNTTNTDAGSVNAMVPSWDVLLNTLPTLMPLVFDPAAQAAHLPVPQCSVPENVSVLLKSTPYTELYTHFPADFERLGITNKSCKAEGPEAFLSFGNSLCGSPVAVRSFLCTYLDANLLFTGNGLTSGGAKEYITVPSPQFAAIQQGHAGAALIPFELPFKPGSEFRCLSD